LPKEYVSHHRLVHWPFVASTASWPNSPSATGSPTMTSLKSAPWGSSTWLRHPPIRPPFNSIRLYKPETCALKWNFVQSSSPRNESNLVQIFQILRRKKYVVTGCPVFSLRLYLINPWSEILLVMTKALTLTKFLKIVNFFLL